MLNLSNKSMNKFYKVIIILSFIFTLSHYVNAGDRMMLIEFFTSSTCGPCAANNPIMTAFLNSQDPTKITAIGFHMNWPSPGNDPMFLYNQTDNNTRRSYYGINSIPEGRFDGIISVLPNYTQAALLSYFNQRKDILSPVTIILTDSTYATDSVLVRAKIFCETFLPNPVVTVYLALSENHIHYTSPPGTNGESDFYNVMRKMYPTGAGSQVTLYPGTFQIIEQRFKKDPVWQWSEISPLAYVQDVSKEILNSARITTDFTLLANPGFRVVSQGATGTANYKIRIPVAASSFNSPVTFTAAVNPVTTGVTAVFNNGNVISNYSDSLNLQVNSTTSVPAGVYNVIVTGTSANGKIHKISMDYLVGKNYVTVRTNYSSLDFKVNNVTYTNTKAFIWDLNSQQSLAAISPQTFNSLRYVFTNWSNSGDTSQTITVNANTSEYVANFKQQFRIMSYADPSGIPVTITNGNQYTDSASSVTISVAPVQLQFNNMTYYFNHWVGSGNGSYNGSNSSFTLTVNNPINQIAIYDTINVGISQINSNIPDKYCLYQNYPNPFNPVTKIKFDIKTAGLVNIKIYDILGKEVSSLYSGYLSAGKFETNFNATNFASGIYFYKLETANFVDIKRMMLIK